MVTNSVLLHLFVGCKHFDCYLLWHHCDPSLASGFCVGPSQLGSADPHWRSAEFGVTLRIDNLDVSWFRQARGHRIQIVKKVDICQASPTSASTLSLPDTLCWFNLAPLPKMSSSCEALHCFSLPFPCLRQFSRVLLFDRSRFLGLALRLSRSCLSMPTGNSTAMEAGTCAVSRAWIFSCSFFTVASSHFGRISLRCVDTSLSRVFHAEHLYPDGLRGLFFKGHWVSSFYVSLIFLANIAPSRFTFSGLKSRFHTFCLVSTMTGKRGSLLFWTHDTLGRAQTWWHLGVLDALLCRCIWQLRTIRSTFC